ncbi:MAG TPA: hypothetical protein VH165_19865 [Kofleriaceae bacterium]|jgi:hypothetical protein|nr:hypothetical protein [Kofleriaceae bacterium]
MAADPPREDPRVIAAYLDDATAYRYPSPTGKRKGGPSHDEVSVWLTTIAGMSAEARALVAASGPGSRGR